MTHIMVDLETLSTRANARIVAIGAVKFTAENGIYDKFYQPVATPPFDQLRIFNISVFNRKSLFHIDEKTLEWWADQSEEAKEVFDDPNAVSLDTALKSFSSWVLQDNDKDNIYMWGNGAAFDNAILSMSYALCGLEQPWHFWNDSCYRTVKRLHPDVSITRYGTHHNALDDAESQAAHLLEMGVVL